MAATAVAVWELVCAESMLVVTASRLRGAAPMPVIAVGMHASFSDLFFCFATAEGKLLQCLVSQSRKPARGCRQLRRSAKLCGACFVASAVDSLHNRVGRKLLYSIVQHYTHPRHATVQYCTFALHSRAAV